MKYDELYALFRRRGVLWPTAEIYGGAQGLFDYGPLGAAIKRRIEDAWRTWFVGLSPDYYVIDPPVVLPESVVRASGHLENFTDPEVICGSCRSVFRAETVLEKIRPDGVDGLSPQEIRTLIEENHVRCPQCGAGPLEVPQPFNLMFGVDFGATGGERAYLRPETAQNSYLAFARMWEVGRKALPLGIAVIGGAYRNEIAPRQVLFRMRAFTQAELQIFFDPESFPVPLESVAEERLPVLRASKRLGGSTEVEHVPASSLVGPGGLPEFYVYHLVLSYRFFRDVLRYPPDRLRLLEKSDAERAFYNRIQFDVEVRVESLGGFKEAGAVHYRGDWDLGRHGQASGKDLTVPTEEGKRVLPHVLELTFGVDRNLWALGDIHFAHDGDRTVWRLPPYLAPAPAAVFPLLRKPHTEAALRIVSELSDAGVVADYDATGTIGKRYARSDEAGIPFCLTVDRETVTPGQPHFDTVTLRRRDSKEQERIRVDAAAVRILSETRFPRAVSGPAGSP